MIPIGWNFQQSTWLVLAIIWAATSVVAWLLAIAFGSSQAGLTDSGVVLEAILIAAISVALRMPIFLGPTEWNRGQMASAVWWLCWLSVINWLGYLGLRTPDIGEFGLCFTLLSAVEACLYFEIVRLGRSPWQLPQTWSFTPSSFSQTPVKAATALEHLDENTTGCDYDGEMAAEEASLSRKTVEGKDLDGRRYLSGWVKFHLAHQQKNDSLSIAFCPAIIGEPEIELECQPESITAKSSIATPNGMRIELRRSEANQPLSGTLYWQATELPGRSSTLKQFPRSSTLP